MQLYFIVLITLQITDYIQCCLCCKTGRLRGDLVYSVRAKYTVIRFACDAGLPSVSVT